MHISLATPLIGIRRGQQTVREAAGDIALAATAAHPVDLAESFVKLKQGKLQVQASAEALRVELETIDSLLNIRA